jgi:hypothetical protein
MVSGPCRALRKIHILGSDDPVAYVLTRIVAKVSSRLPLSVRMVNKMSLEYYMEHSKRSKDPSGALGLGQSKATRIFCAFYVFYYTTPLLVGAVLDKYVGRFRTMCYCSVLVSSARCLILHRLTAYSGRLTCSVAPLW